MLNRRFSFAYKPHAKARYLLFIAALLALALGTAPAKPVQAEPVPLAGAASPGGLLNPDGTLDTTTGFQGTLDLRGWEVTLDGERGPLLKQANSPAALPIAWHALPDEGLKNNVRALAVSGDDLYVGGNFTQTGDGSLTDLGYIARYDTTDSTWHALPYKGLNGLVIALAVYGDDLYVGGYFTQTGNGWLMDLGNIARYNTTTGIWHALPKKGLEDGVNALAVSGGDLYVGGNFTQTGDGSLTRLGYIARYDMKADTWYTLPNKGLNNFVTALAVSGDDLYVGGLFAQDGGGSLTDLGYIVRYNTTAGTWHALPNKGLNYFVTALAVSGDDLYVGGYFTTTGDGSLTDLGNIARYNTTACTWYALPNQGFSSGVNALAVSGDDLYVGGYFTTTGDGSLTDLGRIARYNTTAGTWHALPNKGLNGYVNTLAVSGDDLYVGGRFTQTGDGSLTDLGHIARYTPVVVSVYLPLVVR